MNHRSGFTLIEIMVVIAILGLLAALVVPNVFRSDTTAREKKAAIDCRAIADAVRMFMLNEGRNPQLDELERRDGDRPPYIERISKDPWGGDYTLHFGEYPEDLEVRSAGKNGIAGDDDDVSSKHPPD